jgi:hypothetical protein
MSMPILIKLSKGRRGTQGGLCYCTKETKSIPFLESYCIFLRVIGSLNGQKSMVIGRSIKRSSPNVS